MGRLIRRVACAMSGGVDSAVAALMLKRKGYEVVGFYMRNWDVRDEQDGSGGDRGACAADRDAADASWVCRQLDMPFHEVDFVKEYWNSVFSEMVSDYERGLTPNPDVLCNRCVKFAAFYQHARHYAAADAIATGHYARLSSSPFPSHVPAEPVRLLRSLDRTKDQTLFLSQVSQRALRRTIFPLGELTKAVVKEMACSGGLERIARKKESMGICFIGKRRFGDFMAQYVDPRPGKFIDLATGTVVGNHNGFHQWTVGQGCAISGRSCAYYVVEKLLDSGDILVASDREHPALYSSCVLTGQPHWIHVPPRALYSHHQLHCMFRSQHGREPVPCVVSWAGGDTAGVNDGVNGGVNDGGWQNNDVVGRYNRLCVTLQSPMRAITPGQYAVFYDGDECLGSARIIRPGRSLYADQTHNNNSSSSGDEGGNLPSTSSSVSSPPCHHTSAILH